jgi:type IV pilus assembly protein PilA
MSLDHNRDFTLNELMIVFAILAAIAIPTYRNYVIRAQASAGITLSAAAQTAVAEFRNAKEAFPATNASAELPAAGSISGYVSSVELAANGVIQINFSRSASNPAISQSKLVLSALDNGGNVDWSCKGNVDPQFAPVDAARADLRAS